MKIIIFLFSILLIASCAVQKTWLSTGGSKSDATITLAYEYGIFQLPETKVGQALDRAIVHCKLWGYQDALGFHPESTCLRKDSNDNCTRWRVSVKYQCTKLK